MGTVNNLPLIATYLLFLCYVRNLLEHKVERQTSQKDHFKIFAKAFVENIKLNLICKVCLKK